jgi:hypothetical protein
MYTTFSILFWLSKARKNRKGKCPIYIRITVNGKRSELSSGKWIEENNWNVKAGKVRGSNEEAKSINKHLDNLRIKLNKIYDKFIEEDKLPSSYAIKNIYQGKTGSRKTLLQILADQKSRVNR